MNFITLFDGLWYVGLVAIITIFSVAAKNSGLFIPIYKFIYKHVKSKRIVVALVSTISGVLPIEGRTIISAGLLDSLAPIDKRRKIYGIIDYLSTHHYYFWSPLEKTILLPLAGLGISYITFIGMIWPLLLTTIIFIIGYLFIVLKENDVIIEFHKINKKSLNELKWVDWKTLSFITGVIILANIFKMYSDEIKNIIVLMKGSLLLALSFIFISSFIFGSSSKYAGFVTLLTIIFGMNYFPLFFAVGYSGYMLSPTHKCLITAQRYFHTNMYEFYKVVISMCIFIIVAGIILVII